jgi:hypothetical protein
MCWAAFSFTSEMWRFDNNEISMGVEKGTKAVISVNFSVYGERTFNNLRTNFIGEIS